MDGAQSPIRVTNPSHPSESLTHPNHPSKSPIRVTHPSHTSTGSRICKLPHPAVPVTRDVTRHEMRDVMRNVTRDVMRNVTRDVTRGVTRDMTRDVTRDVTSIPASSAPGVLLAAGAVERRVDRMDRLCDSDKRLG